MDEESNTAVNGVAARFIVVVICCYVVCPLQAARAHVHVLSTYNSNIYLSYLYDQCKPSFGQSQGDGRLEQYQYSNAIGNPA